MSLPPFLRPAMRSAMPLSPDLPSWSRTEVILSALPPTVARVAKPPARVATCAARSAMLVLPLAMSLPRSSIFCAATDAASPSPKAVPLTEASALPMILSTLAVSYLRALSLVWARSMLSARSKPPFAVRPAMLDAMPVMVPTPTLPILPNAPPMVEMMLLPLFLVPVVVPSLMEPSMALPRPLVLGLMMM